VIEYAEYGTGPTKLIGLHGWFGDETCFKPLELSLDPKKFHCVWLAHRGYGKSKSIEGEYTMEEMADDALAITSHLGWDKYAVIGHSMGGKAAQIVAAREPARVRKLVAVTPVQATSVSFDASTRDLFEAASRDAASRRTVINFSTGGRLSSVWVERLAADSIARSSERASASYLHSWLDDDFTGVIRGSNIPTVVFVGANDAAITVKSCQQAFAGLFSDITIEELQNSGHYPMEEVPLALGARVSALLNEG